MRRVGGDMAAHEVFDDAAKALSHLESPMQSAFHARKAPKMLEFIETGPAARARWLQQ